MDKKNRIGCSGWYYKEWKGKFYPKELLAADYLSYYCKFFNTIEINSTFYRFPSSQMVQSWYYKAPKGFKYSLKVNKYITHTKRLKLTSEALNNFYSLSDNLKDKMGCFLFQFPKSFVFNDERLERLYLALNPHYENVVEFRHASWWNPKVIEMLSAINGMFCTVSGLGLPEDLVVIEGRAYIRFHGDTFYTSPYSQKDLSLWKEKIQSSSLSYLWAYFNNTRNAWAPHDALLLGKELEK